MFVDEGGTLDGKNVEKGTFIVERTASNNNFICARVVEGDESPEEEVFDMCYAIERIRAYEEK